MSRHLLRPKVKRIIHARSRRPTAIVPTNVSGLQLWLDFTDLTKLFQDVLAVTPVVANNDPIGRVNDKSVNANNFIQAGATQKPLYQSTNGGALFDGSNDVLAGANTNLNTASKTILIAATPITFLAHPGIFFGGSTTGLWYFAHSTSSNNMLASYKDNTNTQRSPSASNIRTAGVHDVCVCIHDDTADPTFSLGLRRNGSLIATSVRSDGYSSQLVATFFCGALASAGSNGVNATIRHVLVYNAVLTPAQIGGLETYLAI